MRGGSAAGGAHGGALRRPRGKTGCRRRRPFSCPHPQFSLRPAASFPRPPPCPDPREEGEVARGLCCGGDGRARERPWRGGPMTTCRPLRLKVVTGRVGGGQVVAPPPPLSDARSLFRAPALAEWWGARGGVRRRLAPPARGDGRESRGGGVVALPPPLSVARFLSKAPREPTRGLAGGTRTGDSCGDSCGGLTRVLLRGLLLGLAPELARGLAGGLARRDSSNAGGGRSWWGAAARGGRTRGLPRRAGGGLRRRAVR